MFKLLTAEEMAKELKISVKTFYKRVRKYNVPFVDSRQKMFEPAKVLKALETTQGEKIEGEPAGRRSPLILSNQKYREILGL